MLSCRRWSAQASRETIDFIDAFETRLNDHDIDDQSDFPVDPVPRDLWRRLGNFRDAQPGPAFVAAGAEDGGGDPLGAGRRAGCSGFLTASRPGLHRSEKTLPDIKIANLF